MTVSPSTFSSLIEASIMRLSCSSDPVGLLLSALRAQQRDLIPFLKRLSGLYKPAGKLVKLRAFARGHRDEGSLDLDSNKSSDIVVGRRNLRHPRISGRQRVNRLSNEDQDVNKLNNSIIELLNRESAESRRSKIPQLLDILFQRKEAFHELPLTQIYRKFIIHINHILVRKMEYNDSLSSPGGVLS